MKKLLLPISALLLSTGLFAQTHYYEDFTAGLGAWTLTDADTDGNNWQIFTNQAPNAMYGDCMTSASWASVALMPDNWAVSPAITVPGTVTNASLLWKVYAQDQGWTAENYSVYVATASDIVSLGASTTTFTEVLTTSAAYMDRSLDVSAFIGQTIYVAFRHHNVSDQFRMNIDEVSVKTLLPDDVTLTALTLDRYAATSTNTQLSIDVTNAGSNAVTALTVDWNDGTAHSQVITVSIPVGGSAVVNHPDFVTYASAVEKNISVTISQVNGGADSNPADNSAAGIHNTVSQIATKKVVIEEGTGTWCGWCPRGAVAMEAMSTNHPNDFIGIAVHNGDPMMVTAYDAGASFGGFPSSNIDRSLLDASVSTANFENYYASRINNIVPAGLAVSVTGTGATADVTVDATFYTPFAAANYRLAVVIVEDAVTGVTTGSENWDQTNYYAGGGNGVMGGYETLADPVPAADMVYDHVGRDLLGGYNGLAASVPAVITDGLVASNTFNYTVPATSVRGNMHAVALLIDQTNGEIVSAEEVSLSGAGINELDAANIAIYPNPATDVLNVHFDANNTDYTVSIVDLQGRTMATQTVTNASGQQYVAFPVANLAKGSYLVRVATTTASTVKNVVIK